MKCSSCGGDIPASEVQGLRGEKRACPGKQQEDGMCGQYVARHRYDNALMAIQPTEHVYREVLLRRIGRVEGGAVRHYYQPASSAEWFPSLTSAIRADSRRAAC